MTYFFKSMEAGLCGDNGDSAHHHVVLDLRQGVGHVLSQLLLLEGVTAQIQLPIPETVRIIHPAQVDY